MKKKLMIFLFVLLCPGLALADWKEDFVEDADEFGIDHAVANALDEDVSPDEILTFIITHQENFRTRLSLKALYCAGADRDAVRDAANKLGITVEDISMALEESIAECGNKITLDDRDLMEEPGSSPGSGSNTTNLIDSEDDTTVLITDPASPAQPSSPAAP